MAQDRGDAGRERRSQELRREAAHRGAGGKAARGGAARREPTREARSDRRREPLERVEEEDERAPARSQDAKGVRRADVLAAGRPQIDAPGASDQETGWNPAEQKADYDGGNQERNGLSSDDARLGTASGLPSIPARLACPGSRIAGATLAPGNLHNFSDDIEDC